MRSLKQYLDLYGESHTHSTNLIIHKICVPAIMWSVLGFLHTFQVATVPLSCVMAVSSLLFYLRLNVRVFFAMAIITGAIIFSFSFVPNLRIVSGIVFVLAWIGQFYGHHVEGKKPSFIDDLQFLLIGPVWVLVGLGILKGPQKTR